MGGTEARRIPDTESLVSAANPGESFPPRGPGPPAPGAGSKPNRTLPRRSCISLSPSVAAPRAAGGWGALAPPTPTYPPPPRWAWSNEPGPGPAATPPQARPPAPRPDGGAGRRENGGRSRGSASQSAPGRPLRPPRERG